MNVISRWVNYKDISLVHGAQVYGKMDEATAVNEEKSGTSIEEKGYWGQNTLRCPEQSVFLQWNLVLKLIALNSVRYEWDKDCQKEGERL